MTAHRVIDRLRRGPGIEWAPLAAAEGLPAAGADEDPLMHGWVRRQVLRLAPVARAVLLLRYQQDLDPGEIARTLDLPVNTVKSHLRRSLATLRQRLAAEPAGGRIVGHEP